MIIALPLLPLLALSGYVTIDDVSADAAANKVTIAVTTSAPVESADLRSKIADGKLQVYVDGGHVRRDRRSFKSAGLAVSVLKRDEYAKLEMPLAADLGCAGPVAIAITASGFRASITCKGATVSEDAEEAQEKPMAAAVAKTSARAPAARPTAVPAATRPTAPPSDSDAPANSAAPAVGEAKPAAVGAPVAAAPAPEPVKVAPAPAPIAAPAPAPSSPSSMMMPALALIAIGAAAFFFKRRQQKRSSMIQILETAQLGPKRQLVVARVNGETLILGSSEAGITCLSGLHKLPPMASEWGMSPTQMNQMSQLQMSQMNQLNQMQMSQMNQMNQMAQMQPKAQFHAFDPPPATSAPAKAPHEVMDEGGILTRLFRARGQDKPQEKFDNIELHEFDDLLQESVADQELRRKLSTGLRGKVS